MDPYAITPEEQQAILAETLRGQQMLQQNTTNQQKYSNLAAISQMANNPGAAKAAEMANVLRQKQYGLNQLGNQGFALPGSGGFVSSPMFLQEQATARAQQRGLAADRQAATVDLQAQRLQAAKELQREKLEQIAREKAADRALRGTLAAIAAGNKADRDADKTEAKKQKDLESGVVNFSKSVEKAAAGEFDSSLEIVDSTLKAYKKGELPGYGRFVGAVPNAMLDDEGQVVRTNMQQAANILLKARSGAAVTDPEMRRFLTEVGSGAGMSEEALRNGWDNVSRTFGGRVRNLLLQASPEVYDTYIKQGGADLRKRVIKDPKDAPNAGKVDATAPAGVPPELWKVMTPEEKKLWQN
jgi:hypothetical protein